MKRNEQSIHWKKTARSEGAIGRLAAVLLLAIVAAAVIAGGAAAQSNGGQPAAGQTPNTPANAPASPPSAPTGSEPAAAAPGTAQGQPAQAAPTAAPEQPARSAAQAAADRLIFPEELAKSVRQQSAEVDRLLKAVERVRASDAQLEALRPEIDNLMTAAQATEEALKPRLQAVERQISELGPGPKEGQTAETPAVAAERARLERLRVELQDAIKQSGLARVRAGQLLAYINRLRLENLGRDLQKRELSPLSPAHWSKVFEDIDRVGRQIATVGDNWWTILRARIDWLTLILAGSALLWWGLRRVGEALLARWLVMPHADEPPPYLARVSKAVAVLPLIVAPGLITAGVLYAALDVATLFNEQIRALAFQALKAVALVLVVHGMAKAVLWPGKPAWRLIGVGDTRARQYLLLTTLIAGVYGFDMWFNAGAQALHLPVSVVITENFLANLAFAALLIAFAWLPAPAEADRASARILQNAITWLRVPATLAVIAIVVASVGGYLAFGRFIAGQVMLIAIGAAVLLLGHLAARSLIEPGDWTSGRTATSERAPARFAGRAAPALGILAFLINVVLVVAGTAFLLISWGFSEAELIGWGRSLLFGFEVGGFRISLVQLIATVVLFVTVILLTRLVQQWLTKRVFSSENFDRGIANSVHAGIGYLGVALAALIGISYAGVDLSNLAIIAGALSVGIGFGLNQIASNFISGLIMLIERPIKVGDWVVVGAHQGYVRHISVRATEIETFDRASVIVPNSDFMTSAVQNWTHRNAMGRIIINVGVAYREDPERVLEILKDVAADCAVLLKYPAPLVVFENFGASSLDFSVRGYIADVNTTLSSSTRLRLDIVQAFKEHDIEIPFPQQDIHLRDLDGIKSAFVRAAAERALKARSEPQTGEASDGASQAAGSPLAHGNDNSDEGPARPQ